MKKIIILSLFSFIVCNNLVYGQFFSDNRDNLILSTKRDLDKKSITLNNSGASVDLSEIKGSPYAKESFSPGKLFNKTLEKSYSYFLRYNIYNDIIEIKNENQSVELLRSPNLSATFNNLDYHFEEYLNDDTEESINKGYFVLLQNGKKYKLFLKNIKRYNDPVQAETAYNKSYPASFSDFEAFYMKEDDKRLVQIKKKKKQFLSQIPGMSDEIEKFIKSNKTDLDSEEDLIELFTYMDSLSE